MLDKIIILSCKKQAHLIFTEGPSFTLSSDVDVVPLVMWFLGSPCVRLATIEDGNTSISLEIRRDSDDEVTVITKIGDVA